MTIEYAALRPVLHLPIWVWTGENAEAEARRDADDYNRNHGGGAVVKRRENGGPWT